jgi:hypothetical protein
MQSAPSAVPAPCPNRPAIVPEDGQCSTPPCEAFPDRADKRAVSVWRGPDGGPVATLWRDTGRRARGRCHGCLEAAARWERRLVGRSIGLTDAATPRAAHSLASSSYRRSPNWSGMDQNRRAKVEVISGR